MLKQDDDWGGAVEVEGDPEPLPERECFGKNCLNFFTPTYYKQRRCKICRAKKNGYKENDSPF